MVQKAYCICLDLMRFVCMSVDVHTFIPPWNGYNVGFCFWQVYWLACLCKQSWITYYGWSFDFPLYIQKQRDRETLSKYYVASGSVAVNWLRPCRNMCRRYGERRLEFILGIVKWNHNVITYTAFWNTMPIISLCGIHCSAKNYATGQFKKNQCFKIPTSLKRFLYQMSPWISERNIIGQLLLFSFSNS